MGYAGQGHRWDTARLNSGVQCRAGQGTGGPMAMSRKEVEHTWISKRWPGQHGSRDSGGQARRERVVSRGRVEEWAQ